MLVSVDDTGFFADSVLVYQGSVTLKAVDLRTIDENSTRIYRFSRVTHLSFFDLEHLLVLLCILLYGLIEEEVRSAHPDAVPRRAISRKDFTELVESLV